MEERETVFTETEETLEAGDVIVDVACATEVWEASTEAPDGGEPENDGVVAEDEPAAPTVEEDEPPCGENVTDTATEIAVEATDWNELSTAYPGIDLSLVERDATVGALLRGEVRPTPRQAYEITHMDAIVEARVAARVAEQIEEQVAEQVAEQLAHAVRESEARLLEHIRLCGQRPMENGVHAAAGVRMHPAVGRLTRSDRAALAKRAERGETIRL